MERRLVARRQTSLLVCDDTVQSRPKVQWAMDTGEMSMRIVVGPGSIVGYFGGRLAVAGRDVTFLVRERRAEVLKAIGLRMLSPAGDLHIHCDRKH
jgi:hypothetical protein